MIVTKLQTICCLFFPFHSRSKYSDGNEESWHIFRPFHACQWTNGILVFITIPMILFGFTMYPTIPHTKTSFLFSVLSTYSMFLLLLLLFLWILHEINSNHVLIVLARILFEMLMPKYRNVSIKHALYYKIVSIYGHNESFGRKIYQKSDCCFHCWMMSPVCNHIGLMVIKRILGGMDPQLTIQSMLIVYRNQTNGASPLDMVAKWKEFFRHMHFEWNNSNGNKW